MRKGPTNIINIKERCGMIAIETTFLQENK